MGQADRERLGVNALGQRHTVRMKENRDIDVAGIVQLKGPLLAHGDAEPSRDRAFLPFAQARDTACRELVFRGHRQRGHDGGVGEQGQRAGHLVEVPDPAQVAKRRQQVKLAFQLTQANDR